MTMGTITVSSLGDTGAEAMTGVIFPPQVALIGLGAPHVRPWVVDGAVVPRHVVTLTVSADHRVSDGGRSPASSPLSRRRSKRPRSYDHDRFPRCLS
jgi:pyruvate dehydrogenase E2 component (dihydrolipoamide acetyltransferase)